MRSEGNEKTKGAGTVTSRFMGGGGSQLFTANRTATLLVLHGNPRPKQFTVTRPSLTVSDDALRQG